MLNRDVLMLSGKVSKIWKQAKEIAECAFRAVPAGLSSSWVLLQLCGIEVNL